MIFKRPKLLQSGLGVLVGLPQPPGPLGGEKGQLEDLLQGRVSGSDSVRVRGCWLTRSPGRSGGERRLSGGTLGQRLLLLVVVVIVVLLLYNDKQVP